METIKIAQVIDKQEIINRVNKHRLANKNNWYQAEVYYNGYIYKIKAYNTWIQILRKVSMNGSIIYNESSSMDISVGKFKDFLHSHLA